MSNIDKVDSLIESFCEMPRSTLKKTLEAPRTVKPLETNYQSLYWQVL